MFQSIYMCFPKLLACTRSFMTICNSGSAAAPMGRRRKRFTCNNRTWTSGGPALWTIGQGSTSTESAGDVTLYPRRNYTTNNVLVTITPQIINNPSNTANFRRPALTYTTTQAIQLSARPVLTVCHTFQECNVGNINKTCLGFAKIISAH